MSGLLAIKEISKFPDLGKMINSYDHFDKSARLDRLGWNTVFQSLIQACKKLQALGHTYYNGKVVVISPQKEEASDD